MKKLSEKEIEDKINKNNPTLKIIKNYLDNRSDFMCLICGYKWIVKRNDVINGRSGCPECGRKKSKETKKHNISTEQFKDKIYNKYGDKITILGEYISVNKGILVKCNICDYEWKPKAVRLVSKETNCYNCSCKNIGLKIRKTHNEYIDQVRNIYGDKIKVLSEYTKSCDNINVVCTVCEHTWTPNSASLLRRGCPKCNNSKGELKISKLLSDLNINFKEQYIFENLKTDFGGIPKFDFVLFNGNKITDVIEFDGIQHFEPIEKWGGMKRFEHQKEIDLFKNNFCIDNNINMHRIPYNDLKLLNINYIKKILKINY